MTTYAYRIVLSDSEMIAVQEALSRYADICKSELADGPKVPYLGHLRHIDAVRRRLFADAQMMSTSSFCYPKHE